MTDDNKPPLFGPTGKGMSMPTNPTKESQ